MGIQHDELWDALDDRQFRRIDGSIRSLVAQLVLATCGIAAAAGLTWAVADLWLGVPDDTAGFSVRTALLVVFSLASLQLTSGGPIRRALLAQRNLVEHMTSALAEEADRHRFRSEFDEALRIRDDEDAVVGVVSRAFDRVDASTPIELLLADASNAHINREAAGAAGAPGCFVTTPRDCPTVRRGYTRHFASSDALDACRHLQHRPDGEISATCVPVTVLGTPVGVIHRVAGPDEPASESLITKLESVADLLGGRLSVVRAMATNERQASVDALTGVQNRRSLGDDIRAIHRTERPYAVVFCDLDHFKDLNDTFGHDAGDRALRLFARVVQETIRDHDHVGRWGGEEFVLLLPNADIRLGSTICDRIRKALHDELQTAAVPPFTASFGVADNTQGRTVERIVALADRAMFVAKATGRDRVVAAEETGVPAEGDDHRALADEGDDTPAGRLGVPDALG